MPHEAVPEVSRITVRPLLHADIDDALALSSTACWNQRAEDWRMLVTLAPHGSFAALSGGRIVGTAIGIDYGGFSWIAMMLVAPEYRGRGLGRRLLQAALEAVPAHTPVRLDATPLGRPLYQAFGFEDETAITRWVADSSSRVLPALAGSASAFHVRRLSEADFPALAVQDREVFGANRRTVLEWALNAAPGYAHAIDGGASASPAQYCLGRPGRLFDQIGPVVAVSDEAAQALAREALHAARGRAVVMDLFDVERSVGAWLQACGFHAQRPLFRMRLPPRITAGRRAELLPRETARDDQKHVAHLREFATLGPDFA